jgi:SAM-dependent methyltransferase
MVAENAKRVLEQPKRGARQSGSFPRSELIDEAIRVRDSLPPESDAGAWDCCTSAYDAFAEAITQPFAEDAARLVRLAPGADVLDVAAGTGAFALAAARRGANVLATDFSAEMIGQLRQKCENLALSNVSAEIMDGQDLELPDEAFDVVASLFGLMFFPDHDQGLRELHRVLKPGGQAVLGVWAQPSRVDLMRLMGEAAMSAMIDLPMPDTPPHWTALSLQTPLQRRVLAAGFSKVYVVSLAHVWTVDHPATVAEILPYATPSASALFAQLNETQRSALLQALMDDLCERQGGGPFAVANEALMAVATKAL